jgi:hypothetical protein
MEPVSASGFERNGSEALHLEDAAGGRGGGGASTASTGSDMRTDRPTGRIAGPANPRESTTAKKTTIVILGFVISIRFCLLV